MSSNSSCTLTCCISFWSFITLLTFFIFILFTYILFHNSSRRIYKFIWYTNHKNTSTFFIRKIISLTKNSTTNCKKNSSFLTTFKVSFYLMISFFFSFIISKYFLFKRSLPFFIALFQYRETWKHKNYTIWNNFSYFFK